MGHENSPKSLPHTTSSRPVSYRAPSWSWASVNSRIEFWDYAYDNKETTAVLEKADCQTDSRDYTGSVTGGHMVVTGPVREAALRYGSQEANHSKPVNYWLETDSSRDVDRDLLAESETTRWWRDFTPDIALHDPALESYIPVGGRIFCLQLGVKGSHVGMKRGSESVLVLTKTPKSNHYRRIGYWVLDREQYYHELGGADSDQSWFDGCIMQTISVE
jgi:hypothetical protein